MAPPTPKSRGADKPRNPSRSPVRPTKLPSAPITNKHNAPFTLSSTTAFYIFFASHLLAALYSPIQDCDEVFNYWEPTHYLTHGHAFQTWEYSPDYAIRSWAYAGLHAIITKSTSILALVSSSPKVLEFYALRSTLAFVCAVCEARLFSKLTSVLNPRVAIFYLLITLTSPGMYHASVAYLPSSFAMYFTCLGIAAFMDWRGGLRTAQGIFCFGTGAAIGWPFAAALAIPFLAEEALLAWLSDFQGISDFVWRIADGMTRVYLILGAQIAVDSFFYKKLVMVPWNIVHYNIFSGNGPDLYGTEPWHFYLRNLALNFHLWLPLALVSLPLLLLQQLFRKSSALKTSYLRGIIFLTPFYLWLTIFTLQPHKEERFMYPAYPALILNASISLHILLSTLGSLTAIPIPLRMGAILSFLLLATLLSIFRIAGTWTAFSAPLEIYAPLHDPSISGSDATVCLGKEWYRFPSHFLLPDSHRAKFIRSEFRGLLPGEFSQASPSSGFGLFPGTWLTPPGMNDRNEEDSGKYWPVEKCDFLVDVRLPSTVSTELERDFAGEKGWEEVKCLLFLDAGSTGVLGRLGWVPEWVEGRWGRVWGRYCLLKRVKDGPGRREGGVEGVGLRPGIETLL